MAKPWTLETVRRRANNWYGIPSLDSRYNQGRQPLMANLVAVLDQNASLLRISITIG